MLGLNVFRGAFMQLILHRADLVPEFSDLSLKGLYLSLQVLRMGSGSIHLRALKCQLLLEVINPPLSVPFRLLNSHELTVDLLVLSLNINTPLDLGFNLKGLLIEEPQLLKQLSVVLGQLLVLLYNQLVVSSLPLDLRLLIHDLLLKLVLLELKPHSSLNLLLVLVAKRLKLGLKWPQLKHLSLKGQFLLLNLVDLLLLFSQLLREQLLLVVHDLEVLLRPNKLVVVVSGLSLRLDDLLSLLLDQLLKLILTGQNQV